VRWLGLDALERIWEAAEVIKSTAVGALWIGGFCAAHITETGGTMTDENHGASSVLSPSDLGLDEPTLRHSLAHHHIPRLVQAEHVLASIHGGGVVGRFNAWLAVQITSKVGTMWAAYLFALLALVSLPAAIASGNTIVIVAWLAQTFLQLVLLPIIIVGQNVQQAANDARAQADHETLTAVHDLTKHIDVLQDQQIQILEVLKK